MFSLSGSLRDLVNPSNISSSLLFFANCKYVYSTEENACAVFQVSKLFPEQEEALKAFIERRDLLLNLPTGFGKSLVFQMTPSSRRAFAM